ncbi:MAG: DUF4136 domain-containing protein [Steroidobacteraceae bacterium]
MRIHKTWLSAMLGLALSGCSSTPHVRVDKAGDAAAKCKSFAWLHESQEAESLTDQRVRAAVLEKLQKKGYSIANEPDCRVTYALNTHERANSKPRVGVGVGGGSGGLGGGIGVSLPVGKRDRYDGELSINVIDAVKNAEIWHGSADAAFGSEDITPKEAAEIVDTVLSKFPDASH